MGTERRSVSIGLIAALGGLLLGVGISVGVRLERGGPVGVPFRPFARLEGRPAPSFELSDLSGGRVFVPGRGGSPGTILYFVRAGCPACQSSYCQGPEGGLLEVEESLPFVPFLVGAAMLTAWFSGNLVPGLIRLVVWLGL